MACVDQVIGGQLICSVLLDPTSSDTPPGTGDARRVLPARPMITGQLAIIAISGEQKATRDYRS